MRTKRLLVKWLCSLFIITMFWGFVSGSPCNAIAASTYKPQGTLVIAVASFGNEAFFPTQASVPELSLMSSTWESLINSKPGSRELFPGLAERWTVSDGGRTYTFYLRKGIQFHGGWGEFTAEDAKYSIEVLMKPGSKGLVSPVLNENVDNIRIVNPYQIVLNLKKPWVDLPYTLVGHRSQVPMLSKKHVEKVGEKEAARHPIGTGPYKFVDWKVGEYIKLEALDSHWRQVPFFKTVILKVVPEEAARIAMLRTGETDLAEMSLAFKEEVERAGLKVFTYPNGIFCQIWLSGQVLPTRKFYDPKLPWVGDYKDGASQERAKKVRMAMNLAVDRKAIIDGIFKGMAEPSAVAGSFDKSWWPTGMKPYPYDPAAAKRLLAEAGYPNGFEMTLKLVSMPGRPEGPLYGEAVAQMWEKTLGLKVKRETADYSVMLRPLLTARNSNWGWTGDTTFFDEPFMLLTRSHLTTSPFLFPGLESHEIDSLVEAASQEFDAEKRRKINQAIGTWYYDRYSHVPLCIKSIIWGVSKQVGEWPIIPGNSYPHNFEYITPTK
jgi:peptide/nickel transport system substrate-binding protein